MNGDSRLIDKILDGDNEAFSYLMQKYQTKLFSFLFHLTLSKEDAEDLTQVAFIKAFKSLHKFNTANSFLPWALKIALNAYRDFHYKKKHKNNFLSLNDLPEYICSEDSISNKLDEYESSEKVVRLINKLKKGQKEVFILRFGRGFSYSEIGEILGISESAAKMKYLRAKESLTKKISQVEDKEVLR